MSEDDRARILAEAEREAAAIVDDARRRAGAFADARIRRIRELTDRLIATAENVDRRFGDAAAVKDQLDDLIHALGSAAQRVALEERTAQRGLEPLPDHRPNAVRVLDVADEAAGAGRVS